MQEDVGFLGNEELRMRRIVLIACLIYALMIAAGAGIYFSLGDHSHQAPPATPVSSSVKAPTTAATQPAEENADRRRETTLRQEMKVVERNGLTLYTFDYPKKPEPGVYLRPFIVTDGVEYELKFDVYYFYDIADPQKTAWIHGDALMVTTDAGRHTLTFSAKDRRDKMATDAEDLAENYVHTATKEEEELLSEIGSSNSVSLHYYQQESGAGRTQQLTQDEIKKIHDTLELYHLETQGGVD